MRFEVPEIIIGAVIVYLLMKPQPAPEPEIAPEEEAAVEEEVEEPAKVLRRPIPQGFLRGLEESPTGPPSQPSMSAALRAKLERITDP